MMKRLLLALSVALIAVAALTPENLAAQSISMEPYYGRVTLRGGFMPDPHVVKLTAGGGRSVNVGNGSCSYGNVSDRPDLNLTYEGNGSRTLYIYAEGSSDITLLVNMPNASWRCDDDGLGNLNPILVIPNAPSGLYNIWVGTYGSDMTNAMLYITEIDPR
jgi:hypothetical protein